MAPFCWRFDVESIDCPLPMLPIGAGASDMMQGMRRVWRQPPVDRVTLCDARAPTGVISMEGGHGYGTFDGCRYSAQTVLYSSLCAGAHRDRDRCPAGSLLPAHWRGHEATRRRLHQTDQDAHRADHLLHRRAWHRQHGGYEES